MDIQQRIEAALDEVRPHLQMDGGNVEFISFDEATGVLKLRLQGACHGCAMAVVTMRDGIGKTVMAKVPEVKSVVAA